MNRIKRILLQLWLAIVGQFR